ncbi:hypothetical protein EUAN_07140 [Andreesenia angusta]|uniref:Uncharacterized protein n=1 Tax=Andreesenia angusta TaxID=39480 RepID=A0A1S1V953_9FIRM|nr:hypothetical protein [Andreesenia angusta]OHW62930.1 hypothetical protein EUAN_07140 [Andreesenia angusta]
MKEHNLITNDIALKIIDSRKPLGAFYTIEQSGTYVGIDNTTGDAWTEDFERLEDCLNWLDDKEAKGKSKRKLDANTMLEDVRRILKGWGDKFDASRTEIIHTAQTVLAYIEVDEEE